MLYLFIVIINVIISLRPFSLKTAFDPPEFIRNLNNLFSVICISPKKATCQSGKLRVELIIIIIIIIIHLYSVFSTRFKGAVYKSRQN